MKTLILLLCFFSLIVGCASQVAYLDRKVGSALHPTTITSTISTKSTEPAFPLSNKPLLSPSTLSPTFSYLAPISKSKETGLAIAVVYNNKWYFIGGAGLLAVVIVGIVLIIKKGTKNGNSHKTGSDGTTGATGIVPPN